MNRVKLPEICTIPITDGTHQTPTYTAKEDGIPFISSKDVTTKKIDWTNIKYITKDLHEQLYKRIAPQKNDILLAKNGTTGVAALVEDNRVFDIYVTLAVIRPDLEKVFPKYLLHVINSDYCKKQFSSHLVGIGVPNLHLKDINQTSIPLPSLPEQQKIAAHLDSIQSAIDNKKLQLQQLDELVKSKFVEMFGDVSLNDKNFDTEIGKNLFKFSSGKFLSAEFRLESGIPVYGGNGIAWYTEKPLIEYSTIIIGRVGAYCGNVKLVTEPVWITDNALFIKEFKTSRFNLQFLLKLMENINFAKYAGKVAQPKITQGPLEEQVYIIPPIELQNKFAEYVHKIDSAKSIIKTQLADLQELLDSKMDEYFGE